MIKNLVVVVSGGALAFGLAGAVSPAMALASVAHPAGVTRATLPMPDGTPIIRDSNALIGGPACTKLMNPPDPPIIRHSVDQNAPPTIRDAKARTSGAQVRQPRESTGHPDHQGRAGPGPRAARFGDPDDGGQVQVFAALSDPDDGGQ